MVKDIELSTFKSDLVFKVTAPRDMWLVNNQNHPVQIAAGTFILGFFQGSWRHMTDTDEELGPNELLFQLDSSNDFIQMNSQRMTVLDAFTQREQIKPAEMPQLCYHVKVTRKADAEEPTGTVHFDIKHKMVFGYKNKEEGKLNQAVGASLLPSVCWKNKKYVDILWACKWATNGIQPIRPLIVARAPILLPGLMALPLHESSV